MAPYSLLPPTIRFKAFGISYRRTLPKRAKKRFRPVLRRLARRGFRQPDLPKQKTYSFDLLTDLINIFNIKLYF
jgi:hypothetical protein